MNKQDMLKVQTCVLRVNIHCEGCMHKVKKKLQKVEGVYKVSIDSEQGKVVVSGNADPANLIDKLEKAGKHAELWGPPQKGGAAQFPIHQQLNKFQIESLHKNQKGGNEQQQQQQMMKKNGFVQIPLKKGSKEEKFPPKDLKSVRFELPHHHEEEHDDDDEDYDDEDDDFDEYDYEEDDEFEDEFEEVHSKPPPTKAAVKEKPNKAAGNGHKGDKGGGEDGKAKKGGGGGIDMFIKGMLKKAGGGKKEKSKSDKSSKKKETKDGGKNGGKKGEFEFGDVKKGKNDDGWSKKGGESFHGGKQQHLSQMKPNHKGGGGGGGKNMEMMGQKGGFPAVAGMPAMNGGRVAGVGPGNPYNQQQQLMAQMMMMNQQRENGGGHEAYHPNLAYARPPPPAMSYGPAPGMGYGPPPPHMGYGPPQHSAEYTHMFSDENTDSCSVM